MLIGLGKMIKKVTSNLNLLASRLIGYTSVIGSGGSSYYTTTTGSVSTKYIVTGSNTSAIAVSTDGLDWSMTYLGGDYGNDGTRSASGNGVYAFSNANGKVHSTTNGTDWVVSRPVGSNYYDQQGGPISFVNNKFFMPTLIENYGNVGHVYSSTNAIDWVQSSSNDSPVDLISSKIVYANGVYAFSKPIFDTATAAISRSVDGLAWTNSTVSFGQGLANTHKLSVVDDKFILIHTPTGKIYYSTDAINFTLALNLEEEVNGNVVSIGGTAVFRTQAGAIVRTTNGTEWNKLNASVTAVGPINLANSLFVVCDSSGNISYSDGGYDWTNTNPSFTWSAANFPVSFTSGGAMFEKYTDAVNISGPVSYVNGRYLISAYPIVRAVGESGDGNASNVSGFMYSTNLSTWTPTGIVAGVYGDYGSAAFNTALEPVTTASLSTLVEVQVSIGNQGEEGSEILAPIDVYTVSNFKTTDIQQVTVKNNSANTITYDLAVLNSGIELTDQNALINDQAVLAGATATVTSITNDMTAGQRIVVLPSAVDVVEVKVYGTETSI